MFIRDQSCRYLDWWMFNDEFDRAERGTNTSNTSSVFDLFYTYCGI